MAGGHSATCGFGAMCVFIAALIAGTACSLTSKIMLSMRSVGLTGIEEDFSFPLFQTFGMFLGMTAGLVMHIIVQNFNIPFPGYSHKSSSGSYVTIGGEPAEEPKTLPFWMYMILIIPSMFDLVATALCMFGLRYVNVSIYQMLRGGAIVFVAILKQFVLGDKLKKFMWIGVFWNVLSIVLVGLTAMLSLNSDDGSSSGSSSQYSNPMVGIMLILCGALVQSLQYAFEERVMSMEIAAPPLLLIGMEGLWGSVICLFVLYPLAYHMPGSDHGSIENPYNTIAMIQNSPDIQNIFVVYFISILLYNILACLVTFMLNSVWHAILDNFRPISVWTTDLFIFYNISKSYGESWSKYSYIQLLGLFILLYGTAVYNAPNAGSIQLTGGFSSCLIDCSDEYAEALEEHDEFDDGPSTSRATPGVATGFMSTMSPFMSPRVASRRAQEMQDGKLKGSANGSYGSTELAPLRKKGSFA